MKLYRSRVILLLLYLLCFSANSVAEQGYLGIGVAYYNLNTEHSSVGHQSGNGLYFYGGVNYDKWGVEANIMAGSSFETGPTTDIYYPADRAEYAVIDLSVKRFFDPVGELPLTPWIAIGNSLHLIAWETFFYNVDGNGISLSAGADYKLRPDMTFRVSASYYNFISRDTYGYGPYEGTTTAYNFSVYYAF